MARKRKSLVEKHELIPEHSKLTDKEKKELFDTYKISEAHLPKIRIDDPAIAKLNTKGGDVIKINRKSPTAIESTFFRSVIDV